MLERFVHLAMKRSLNCKLEFVFVILALSAVLFRFYLYLLVLSPVRCFLFVASSIHIAKINICLL
uniref:Uncharacterized protein n=1 Tax=Arundo donax TaxID=35708 RepID=A0A0A9UE52_ARUDO